MSCTCEFDNGKDLVDRLREKGYSKDPLEASHEIKCSCGQVFKMDTLEYKCTCGLVYGVTPCRQEDINNIMLAGLNY